MRPSPRLLAVPFLLAAAAGAWKAVDEGVELAGVSATVRREQEPVPADVPLAGVRVQRVLPDGGTETLDLGTLDRAVVFAFDQRCVPCNLNMWNWIDIVGAVGDRAPGRLYALTVMPPDQAADYWTGLRGRVQVLVTDTVTAVQGLKVKGPPATLVVRDGKIRSVYGNFLTPRAKDEIVRALTAR